MKRRLHVLFLMATGFVMIATTVLSGCSPEKVTISFFEISPQMTGINEAVTISAELKNPGNKDVDYIAALKINGVELQNKKVVVPAGTSASVSFSVSEQEIGTYTVTLAERTGEFTVIERTPATGVVNQALTVMADVKTYTYWQQMTLQVEGSVGQDEGQMLMTIEMTGAVDKENRRLVNNSNSTMRLSELDQTSVDMYQESYNVNDSSYSYTIYDGQSYGWTKEAWDFGTWGSLSGIALQLGLLSESSVSIAGTGNLSSRECVVLNIVPEKDILVEALSAYDDSNKGYLPLNSDSYGLMADNFKLTHWVFKDDGRLGGYEMIMSGFLPASMLEQGATGVVHVVYSVLGTFQAYNQPVYIELPADAMTAVDMNTESAP